MDSLKDWKDIYKSERDNLSKKLEKEAKKHWNNKRENYIITNLLNKKSIISFSHTFLKDNYKMYFDIIKSLYTTDKKRIVLIGVLHTREVSQIKYEFSLDNFVYCLKLYAKINKLKEIKIMNKIFPKPPKKEEQDKIPEFIRKLEKESKNIKKEYEKGFQILITGDLAHYGFGYGIEKVSKHYKKELKRKIKNIMNIVYNKMDYAKLIRDAPNIKFDQTSVAILTSMILGKNIKPKIIDEKWSDYSKILNAKKPTVVAAITYGIFLT